MENNQNKAMLKKSSTFLTVAGKLPLGGNPRRRFAIKYSI